MNKRVRLKNPKSNTARTALDKYGDVWFQQQERREHFTVIVMTHPTMKESLAKGDVRWWCKDDAEDIDTDTNNGAAGSVG